VLHAQFQTSTEDNFFGTKKTYSKVVYKGTQIHTCLSASTPVY